MHGKFCSIVSVVCIKMLSWASFVINVSLNNTTIDDYAKDGGTGADRYIYVVFTMILCTFKLKENANNFAVWAYVDPFTKRHKLVHNDGFPKFEVLYCSQNTVKSIKIR